MGKTYFLSNVMVSISNVIIGICNWLFLYLILQNYSPEIANSFTAFMSIFLLLSIPSTTISYITNKSGRAIESYIKKNRLVSLAIIFGYFLLCLIFTTKLYNFSLLFSVFLISLILLTFLSSYFKSLLQYRLRFTSYALISITEVIVKVIILLATISFLHNAAWIAFAAQYLVAFIVPFILYLYYQDGYEDRKSILSTTIILTATLFSAGIILYTNIDTLIGKIVLNSLDFNQYQKMLQLGKVLLFFCTGLNLVLIPSIQNEYRKISIVKMFLLTFILQTFFSVSFIAFVSIFFEKISSIFTLHTNLNLTIIFLVSFYIYSISQTASFILFRQNEWKKILASIVLVSLCQILMFFTQRDLSGYILSNLYISVIFLLVIFLFTLKYIKKIPTNNYL